jgi:hypothetical protein
VKYLLLLIALVLSLSGCTASRLGLSEATDASASKVTQGSVPAETTNGPSVPKSSPPSVRAAEPIEASFVGADNLDRF